MDAISKSRARNRKRVINLEASPAWVEWADGLAALAGASRATTIDLAMRRLARDLKYEPKPPRR